MDHRRRWNRGNGRRAQTAGRTPIPCGAGRGVPAGVQAGHGRRADAQNLGEQGTRDAQPFRRHYTALPGTDDGSGFAARLLGDTSITGPLSMEIIIHNFSMEITQPASYPLDSRRMPPPNPTAKGVMLMRWQLETRRRADDSTAARQGRSRQRHGGKRIGMRRPRPKAWVLAGVAGPSPPAEQMGTGAVAAASVFPAAVTIRPGRPK